MAKDNVVEIEFGVLGKDSITEGSGLEIKKDLETIATKIGRDLKVKISVDESYFVDQLNKLKKKLSDGITIKVKPEASSGSESSGGGSKRDSTDAEIKTLNKLYQKRAQLYKLPRDSVAWKKTKGEVDELGETYRNQLAQLREMGELGKERLANVEAQKRVLEEAYQIERKGYEINKGKSTELPKEKVEIDQGEGKKKRTEYRVIKGWEGSAGDKAIADAQATMEKLSQKRLQLFETPKGTTGWEKINKEVESLNGKLEMQLDKVKELVGAEDGRVKNLEEYKGNLDKGVGTEAYQEVRNTMEELYAAKTRLLTADEGSRQEAELKARVDSLTEKLNEQKDAFKNLEGATEDQRTALEQYEQSLKNTYSKATDMDVAKLQDRAASLSTTNGFDKIIKRSREAAGLVEAFQNRVRSLGSNATKEDIKELNTEFVQTQARLREIGEETDTVGNKLIETFGAHIYQVAAVAIAAFARKALSQIYENVVRIDGAMTSLKIVTNANSKEMSNFADTVAESAKKIGSSISDLIDSTTVFARLGYSLEDASILAEKATIYSNVSGVTADDATTNITAIIKAFNVGAEDLEDVLDQLIYVGNNFAISSAEIGEGMNNAASSLSANGNTLQQAIGILTAANVTVQNASKSSTAVRTIAARMAGSTTELEELGESTDSLLSSSKLDEKMRVYGVAVLDATGNLRSTYDVLADIAKVWDEIGTTDRAAIAEMLSGNRQQNVFYSIMQNWSDAEAVVEQASNGYGALRKANEKYLDSIDGKTSQLKASWEEFSNSILDSDLIKIGVYILTLFVKGLTLITNIGDGLPATILEVAAALLIVYTILVRIHQTQTISIMLSTAKAALKVIPAIVAALKSLAISLIEKAKGHALSTKAMLAEKAAQDALNSTNPLGWVMLIATVLIVLYTAIKNIVEASSKAREEAVEAAKESKEAWEDVTDELSKVEDELQETQERIAELQKLSNNGTITLVEQEELDKLQQSISGLEEEKKNLEEIANIKKESAEKDAANAVSKILDEKLSDAYVQEDNTFWKGVGRVYASFFSMGISDAFGFGVSDWSIKTKSASDYVKGILGDWENATDQQREYAVDFYERLSEQKDMLSYHTGDNLEQWQVEANEAYNTYWEYVHRFILAKNSDIGEVWNSILNMERFSNIGEKLKDIANSGEITADSLRFLYEIDSNAKGMIDYLAELGVFSWEDTKKISGLVNQINSLADVTKKTIEKKSFLDVLDEVQDKFDSLSNVLSDIEESSIATADSISKILEEYPALMKFFDFKKYTGADGKWYYQGYGLKEEYSGLSAGEIQQLFVTEYLQAYVDALAECEEGTENYTIAQDNLNIAIATCATLLRSTSIEEETERLNKNEEALEEQLDKYEELINIRKDLLETYQEEIDYKKELAQKQNKVSDLKTQLALANLDKSAEGQARVRELQEELESAQEDLDDLTLEKAINLLIADLDDSYNEYEHFIDDEVEKITAAIDSLKTTINPGVTLPDATQKTDGAGGEDDGENGEETKQPKDRWTSYSDAVSDGYANIRTQREFARGGSDKTKYENYQNYLDAMYEKYIGKAPKYHSGGFVEESFSLRTNEVFAKLLKGEFVSTPAQMDRFISETLPTIASCGGGSGDGYVINYNSPLIEIQCGSVTDDSLPKLKDLVNEAVNKIKKDMSSALSRTGYRKRY